MPLAFADVIPRLLEAATQEPTLARADRIAVVRDRKGLVRLAVKIEKTTETERDALETALNTALGAWYVGPILRTDSTSASGKRLALTILERAQEWPESWPMEVVDPVRGTSTPLDLSRWRAVQRVLSKETWLAKQRTSSPWPLRQQTPTIVSFYSYKGGVGRSTLVAIVAAMLARAGSSVVIIDLDLEAPGQQSLFDAQPGRGVIDYVVEHIALGGSELGDLLVDVTAEVPEATGAVHLAAAGAVDWAYVEKIARLDFAGHTQEDGQSPVHLALQSLLLDVRREVKPDWILLDARTGIHDLGGLAMHAFAHIDVLVGRDGRQGMEGLRLCLQALGRRRDPDDLRTLIVHALAPAPLDDERVSVPIQQAFQDTVYDLFKATLYEPMEDSELPSTDDKGAAHSAHAVPLDPTLGRLETLRAMADMLARPYYTAIVDRLRELAEPEDLAEDLAP
jgi:Mrp family chromosome partitioning ATPase